MVLVYIYLWIDIVWSIAHPFLIAYAVIGAAWGTFFAVLYWRHSDLFNWNEVWRHYWAWPRDLWNLCRAM